MGNTELKSLCFTRRLMLIDIRFMRISLTVMRYSARGHEACMIDGQTSELKLLP